LSISEASSARDPTQQGLPNRREGGHCVKTRLAPVRISAEPDRTRSDSAVPGLDRSGESPTARDPEEVRVIAERKRQGTA